MFPGELQKTTSTYPLTEMVTRLVDVNEEDMVLKQRADDVMLFKEANHKIRRDFFIIMLMYCRELREVTVKRSNYMLSYFTYFEQFCKR